jgi:hypothetical protein
MTRTQNSRKPVLKKKNLKIRGKKKIARQKYNEESLLEAVKKVENGEMTLRKAEAAYEVPKSTIADHQNGITKTNKLGRPALLSNEIELSLVHAINKLADWGFGVSDREIKTIIHNYLL